MTSPFTPPPAPKKLERSRTDKFLFGVCGGVARYLNMDPTLVRVLTVLLTLFTGVPIILYVVAIFVMPEEGLVPPVPPRPVDGSDPVWGATGAPWQQPPAAPYAAAQPQPPAPADPEAPVVPPSSGQAPTDPPSTPR